MQTECNARIAKIRSVNNNIFDRNECSLKFFCVFLWHKSVKKIKASCKGIDYTIIYLERFFRNLLLDDQWNLRNRYLHIHALPEWKVQPNCGMKEPKDRKLAFNLVLSVLMVYMSKRIEGALPALKLIERTREPRWKKISSYLFM